MGESSSRTMPTEERASKRLKFAKDFGSRKFRMFECPDEVLASLSEHRQLRIVGEDKAELASLCTHDKTYQIRFLEYSNTQLVTPPAGETETLAVTANLNGYYELKEYTPRLMGVRNVLKPYVDQGGEASGEGLTMAQLEAQVRRAVPSSPIRLSATVS